MKKQGLTKLVRKLTTSREEIKGKQVKRKDRYKELKKDQEDDLINFVDEKVMI